MDVNEEIMDNLDRAIATSDRINALCAELRELLADGQEVAFVNGIELCRVIQAASVCVGQIPDIAECTADMKLDPTFLSQTLIQHLAGTDGWSVGFKTYWMRVADHMGPDWIAEFTTVGAFMRKVEGF